ncbi:uncharacterized protein [Heterodontus francisci]|uniref:uncharacterized protein isoform X2 n=1 Tax=Heterodontus francisci TaxID=7792 RepID=UPI00355B6CE7
MFFSSKDVIHSVAKNLKYYIDVQRKEDGFDLSGIDRPQLLYPNLKPNFDHGDTFNMEKLKIEKRNQIHHCPKFLHQVPSPRISRNEVLRLISSASKVIVATEIIPQTPYRKHSPKPGMKVEVDKPSEKKSKWTQYEVTVHTGSCLGSGSKADIFISFYGEEDKVEDILLCNSLTNHIPFRKGQTDVFLVEVLNVGKLQYIVVGHDRKEPGYGWYLEDIIIKNCSNSATYIFHCNMWLSSQAYDECTFQKFLPYFGQDLDDGENVQTGGESLGPEGQTEKSKQSTKKNASKVVSKATSASTKRWPQTVTNKKSMSCCSTTSTERQDNSHPVLSCLRQSFSSQTTSRTRSTSTISTDSRCEALNVSMPKLFSRGQIEFCLSECQNFLAESPERWPASGAQLKNQKVSKEVNSIDNRNNINEESMFQNFACLNSDERKVSVQSEDLTCTENTPSNNIKESLSVDSHYCEKIEQQIPVSCMEDVEKSNLFGSQSEKEWSEVEDNPKYTAGVPHFVSGCLKVTESKSQISATKHPHENIAAAEDDNNLANMKKKSISSIHDIRNTEFPQKAMTSPLQEGNVTTERTMSLVPSDMIYLESLQNIANSESNFGWGVEEPFHTEPGEYIEEDQVKEAVIFEVSETEGSLKIDIAATELSDSDSQGGTCDTRRTKLMDEKSSCSSEENETDINCMNTDGANLCDVFKKATKTIENGEHYKLENLCQHHSGLPGFADDAGRTILHMAAIYGNAEICQVILQNPGVQKQLDSQDKEGRTALHYGIMHNNKMIKRLLLNNGAQFDIPDNNLETALDLALNMVKEEEIGNS